MSFTLREIAVGVAYATWEIVGGIGGLLISFMIFEQHLSIAQYFGIVFGFIGIVFGEEHSDSIKCGNSANLIESPYKKSTKSTADSAKNLHRA